MQCFGVMTLEDLHHIQYMVGYEDN